MSPPHFFSLNSLVPSTLYVLASFLFSFKISLSFPFFLFFPHINIALYTNSPVGEARMIFINKESIFFFLDYVLGKSKSNRITTDSLIFLVTVGFTFISIKYMKQFSDFFSSMYLFGT